MYKKRFQHGGSGAGNNTMGEDMESGEAMGYSHFDLAQYDIPSASTVVILSQVEV